MHDPYSDSSAVDIMHTSMVRIASSHSSLQTANLLLERSRKTVEGSVKLLQESQRLVQDPFHCSWNRSAPYSQDC